jgi:hypothetical protein
MHLPKRLFALGSNLLVAGLLTSFIPAEAQTPAPANQPGGVAATNSVSAETPPPATVPATNQPARVPPPDWATVDASAPVTNLPPQAAPAGDTNSSFDPVAFLKSTTPPLPNTPPADDSIDALQKKAEAGDAKSQTKLGHLYQAGKGVPKDPNQAVKLYQEAAAQGDAGGQWSLGSCYLVGLGVKQDAAEAVKW